jgi:hypothetical protein
MVPNQGLAYWIYRDANTIWHLKATSGGMLHRFRGTIQADFGFIQRITPSRNEFQDRLRTFGPVHTFGFDAMTGVEGFSFQAPTAQSCIKFYLIIDGKEHAESIRIGADGHGTTSAYVRVCPLIIMYD